MPAILVDVKRLAIEYYAVTGRPLGVVGEIAEFEAAEKLGLELSNARTAGYDAVRWQNGKAIRIQIKGRRPKGESLYRGRVPKIALDKPFDTVVLVLLDSSYEAIEIWEAPRDLIEARLNAPGSKARNERGSLAIAQFKSIAMCVWSRSV
jgi:hypothetical protein